MNVVISNEATQAFGTLDIDIIKSVTGVHSALEIAEMFKSFFFNKMILDVTAVKGCENPDNFKTLVKELDPDKIILYIPDQSKLCTANFLSKLVAMGIYNFTTNIDGVKYLLKKSNKELKEDSKTKEMLLRITDMLLGLYNAGYLIDTSKKKKTKVSDSNA